jgi:hypothetical protein
MGSRRLEEADAILAGIEASKLEYFSSMDTFE